jgi:hypothetical protein
MVYKTMVANVTGTSTKVIAKPSTNGWYIAAFLWRSTIGRWENSAGISDIAKLRTLYVSNMQGDDTERKKNTQGS